MTEWAWLFYYLMGIASGIGIGLALSAWLENRLKERIRKKLRVRNSIEKAQSPKEKPINNANYCDICGWRHLKNLSPKQVYYCKRCGRVNRS